MLSSSRCALANLKGLQSYAAGSYIYRKMTSQELQNLQKQVLQLSNGDRWQLVQVLLDSLKREANLKPKRRNLSRLRGIAKISAATGESNAQADYVTYLTEKYQ